MKDIAEAVGVSKATVSLVLGGKGGSRVSDTVRQKVLDTAKQMGYRSNDLARGLRTGKTNLISVLVTDISNDFFGKMSFYIQEEAKKYGYLVIIANTNESDEELGSMLSVMMSKKVDGIIVVPTQNCRESLEEVIASGTSVVQIDRQIAGMDSPYVGTDNYKSAENGIRQLIGSNHRRIALLTLKLKVNAITERIRAYEEILKEEGIFDPALVQEIDFEEIERVSEAMEAILKEEPDAIFFSSMRVFTLAMDSMSGKKLSGTMPTLLCFDYARSYKSLVPGTLWYIEQPIEVMAKKAFALLMDKINGTTTLPKYEYVSSLVK